MHLHPVDGQAIGRNPPGLAALHKGPFGPPPTAPNCRIDKPRPKRTISLPFFNQAMSTVETKQQTPTPAQIPFTDPPAWVRFVTDTGKILPRKYTGLCAKHQRAVTRTIKHSRNMLLTK
jgi:small subunit ribosomal protein S18